MLGAWQQGSTGLCCPHSFLVATGGTMALGKLRHHPGLSPATAPSIYSHVHNDDHVLWGGGTLDVPVGYRVGSAGLTHFVGTLTLLAATQERSPARARALGSCAGSPGHQGCGDPMARSRDEVAVGRGWRGHGSRGTAADGQRLLLRAVSLMSSKC